MATLVQAIVMTSSNSSLTTTAFEKLTWILKIFLAVSFHQCIINFRVMAINSFKSFVRGVFDKGGVLVIGLGCLYLQRKPYIPDILRPVAFGIITLGAVGFGRHIIMDLSKQWGRHKKPEDQKEEEQRKLDMIEELKLRVSLMMKELDCESTEKDIRELFSAKRLEKITKEMQVKPEDLTLAEGYFNGILNCMLMSCPRKEKREEPEDNGVEIVQDVLPEDFKKKLVI